MEMGLLKPVRRRGGGRESRLAFLRRELTTRCRALSCGKIVDRMNILSGQREEELQETRKREGEEGRDKGSSSI